MRGWMFPYIKSRLLPGEFHPIICYLFTEYKCNLDCHYCWAFDNRVKGMSEDVAKRSIDWLHGTTCRVLALMGGEPLLRPAFVHKVIYYAAKKGFWTYLPTNGRLMRPEVMDRILDAGVATVNLAVDAVDEKPGLPKALAPIRRNFDYLVRRQYGYGATVFFNINICRNNLDDVKALTEIAHDNGIATDYHINESPMLEHENFNHLEENPTFIRREDWPKIDAVLDWLIAKNRSGYKMVNSTARLARHEKVHARRAAILAMPRGAEFPHHPGGWHACSVLSDVLLGVRLGNHRQSAVPAKPAWTHQGRLPGALLFHSQSQSLVLLQRRPGTEMGWAAGAAGLPGADRQF